MSGGASVLASRSFEELAIMASVLRVRDYSLSHLMGEGRGEGFVFHPLRPDVTKPAWLN
jgi:hypothetical protein